jgi:hypothetical protein
MGIGPREVLGVPTLPPAVAAGPTARLRAALARAHRASAPPPARLLESALGGLDLAVLATLCRLEVPDRLDRPRDVRVLARDLGLDPQRFDRLVRYARTRGWVRTDRRGRLRATRTTAFLRRDHPGGWRAWIEFAAGPEVSGALQHLGAGLRPDGDAFAVANGAPFFAWMQAHPARHATFDGAMAAGGRMHGLLLARTLAWTDRRRVCDVGGGTGALLGVLLDQQPHLEGVLLELPEVASRAAPHPRVKVVAGDAFRDIPAGCDTYVLANVVHDWDDRAAELLLERVRTAAGQAPASGPRPRVVVVESEAHERPRDDLATRADLLMLALTPGGRERSTSHLAELGEVAGLRHDAVHRLVSGDLAHVFELADAFHPVPHTPRRRTTREDP